jgi:hypothetical protein
VSWLIDSTAIDAAGGETLLKSLCSFQLAPEATISAHSNYPMAHLFLDWPSAIILVVLLLKKAMMPSKKVFRPQKRDHNQIDAAQLLRNLVALVNPKRIKGLAEVAELPKDMLRSTKSLKSER